MGGWESELHLMLKRAARSTCPGLRAMVTGASSDAVSGRHGVPFGLCHWPGREELGGLLLM